MAGFWESHYWLFTGRDWDQDRENIPCNLGFCDHDHISRDTERVATPQQRATLKQDVRQCDYPGDSRANRKGNSAVVSIAAYKETIAFMTDEPRCKHGKTRNEDCWDCGQGVDFSQPLIPDSCGERNFKSCFSDFMNKQAVIELIQKWRQQAASSREMLGRTNSEKEPEWATELETNMRDLEWCAEQLEQLL